MRPGRRRRWGQSLDEVANLLGLCGERVRQVEREALAKLRASILQGCPDLVPAQQRRRPPDACAGPGPAPRPPQRAAPSGGAPAAPPKANGRPALNVLQDTSPIHPDDIVNCLRLGSGERPAKLMAKRCIARQRARWPGGNRKKDGSTVEKKAGIYPECEGCPEGSEYMRRTAYDPTLDWSKGRYKFFRPDSSEQRKRRRELIRSNLDVVPDLDHPPGPGGPAPPLDLAEPSVLEVPDVHADLLGQPDAGARWAAGECP